MSNDSNFYLHDLSDEKLESILESDIEEKEKYFRALVQRFYPKVTDVQEKENLMEAYNSSFILEYLYRNTDAIAESFTIVYTQTGMIREVVNDFYFIEQEYKFKIN